MPPIAQKNSDRNAPLWLRGNHQAQLKLGEVPQMSSMVVLPLVVEDDVTSIDLNSIVDRRPKTTQTSLEVLSFDGYIRRPRIGAS